MKSVLLPCKYIRNINGFLMRLCRSYFTTDILLLCHGGMYTRNDQVEAARTGTLLHSSQREITAH